MKSDQPEAAVAKDEPETRVPIGIERALGAFAMGALCVITFANVVVRYLTNYSFAFTEEYSIFLLLVMTLLGTAVAAAADRHIRITFLIQKLPPGPRRVCEVVGWAAALATFLFLVWYGGRLAYDQWRFEETSPGLGNPQYLYTIWLPILSLVVCLRILGRVLRLLRGGR